MSSPFPQVIEDFIERMGLSVESEGLPRIAGRIWGFFVIFGGPSSFTELAEKLCVSRGSISTNARILRDLGIIERVARPGDRQDYYRLSESPYDRLLEGYAARMQQTVRNTQMALSDLPEGWQETARRLEEMQAFYMAAVQHTESLIETLRQTSRERGNLSPTPPLLRQSS